MNRVPYAHGGVGVASAEQLARGPAMRQPIAPAERTACAELYRRAAQDAAGRGLFRSAELYLDLYESALADVADGRDPVELEIDIMFEDAIDFDLQLGHQRAVHQCGT